MTSVDKDLSLVEMAEAQDAWVEAAVIWERILAEGRKPAFLARYGDCLKHLNRSRDAQRTWEEAVRQDPECAQAYIRLALLAEEESRGGDAILALERAIHLKSSDEIVALRGLLDGWGASDRARAILERAVHVTPRNKEARFLFGLLLRDTDPSDPKAAISHIYEAMRLDPRHFGAGGYRELGMAFLQAGDCEEAELSFRTALSADRSDCWAQACLGLVLWKKGELGAARDLFRSAVTCDGNVALFWAEWAHLSALVGASQEADAAFREALAREPDDAIWNRRYGLFLTSTGEFERARDYLQRAVQLASDQQARDALDALARTKGPSDL